MTDQEPAPETTPPELLTRDNISEITSLIQAESNAAADEITQRQDDGDVLLADVDVDDTPKAAETPPEDEPAPIEEPDDETPPVVAEAITSFRELADKAGLELSALYDLTINFGAGKGVDEPVKLGAIKDAYQKGLDIDARASDLDQSTREFEENKLLTNQAIDSRIASMNLTEAQVREQGRFVAENKVREQQKLFQVVPELAKNATLREQTHQEIVELVKPYGISAVEIDNIADHRFYKFAMDAVKAFELIATARADAKRVRKIGKGGKLNRKFNGKGSAKTDTDKLVAQAKSTRVAGDQVAAISALLGK